MTVYLRQRGSTVTKTSKWCYFYELSPKLCSNYKEIVSILRFVSGKCNLALVQWLDVVNRNQEPDSDSVFVWTLLVLKITLFTILIIVIAARWRPALWRRDNYHNCYSFPRRRQNLCELSSWRQRCISNIKIRQILVLAVCCNLLLEPRRQLLGEMWREKIIKTVC